MDLSELLAAHPAMRLAGPGDNARALAFFEESAMEGEGLKLRYRRDPDFFAFLAAHSANAFVFLIEEAGAVTGMGTVITRPGYLAGEPAEVGYLGDLRIRPARSTSKIWRAFYSDLVRLAPRIRELRGCRRFLTAIIDANTAARQALVKRRRGEAFAYDELARYEMVTLLARLPGRSARATVEPLTDATLDEWIAFNDACERRKPFGFHINRAELERRLRHWPGLGLGSFVLARHRGRIVAAAALFAPAPLKRIVVDRYPRILGAARHWLALPDPGHELSIEYLTHLQIEPRAAADDRRDAARAIVRAAWDRKRARLLAFARQEAERDALTGLGFVEQTVPMTLYAVRAREEAPLPRGELSGFEIALV